MPVVVWRVDDFAARLADAMPGDQWVSGLYTFKTEYHGPFEFFLRFYPAGRRAKLPPSLYLRLCNGDPRLGIEVEVEAWIKQLDGKRTKPKKLLLKFTDLRNASWDKFLSAKELEVFRTASTVFIHCQMPDQMDAKHKKPWLSDKDAPSWKVANPKFGLEFYPKGNSYEYRQFCSLFFLFGARDNNSPDSASSWSCGWRTERANGTRKRATNFLDTPSATWGWNDYVKQTELLELAKDGELRICCNVNVLSPVKKPTPKKTPAKCASVRRPRTTKTVTFASPEQQS
ncbi:hypothetical protein M3Y99_00305900 [Aphelenchoides fujianensis]|nr:hypothetical protein M3Y99_00305900 [Aphelenchoides fujianensis]